MAGSLRDRVGPLFRPIDRHGNVSSQALTGHSVGLVVKRSAELVGMDGDLFSGHSLGLAW